MRHKCLLFRLCLISILVFGTMNLWSQSSKNTDPMIEGMAYAVDDMDKMLTFYSEIFGIEFKKRAGFDTVMYFAIWRGLKILFVPADLAGEKGQVVQNKIQFDIIVKDLDATIKEIEQLGGSLLGSVINDGIQKTIGVKDPDGNTFIFKENIPKTRR